VNFVKHKFFVVCISKNWVVLYIFLTILLSIYLAGRSDQVRLLFAEQLAEFENAGPVRPNIDMDCLVHPEHGRTAFWTEYSASRSVLICLYGNVKNKKDAYDQKKQGRMT